MNGSFQSPYSHGFVRVAVCVPRVQVADPFFNVKHIAELAQIAAADGVALALFPELSVSAYTCDDLFHQMVLLEGVLDSVKQLAEATQKIGCVIVVGAPLKANDSLYNCAVILYRGEILGIAPKTYLPNYREFYEKRQFVSASDNTTSEITLFGKKIPFGNNLIFDADNLDGFSFHAEICEDVWSPIPPSTLAALSGATILLNLSASNITVGKAEYRKNLCAAQSGKCVSAYLYAAAGPGESTNDLAWDGHSLVYENGTLLCESERFQSDEHFIVADLDVERLQLERMRQTSFADSRRNYNHLVAATRHITFNFDVPDSVSNLKRTVERFPFVPNDPLKLDEQCYEAYNIQVHGLLKRLQSSGVKNIVIGVSGGLDSTHALIVAAKTMDRLGLPRENIHAFTMPGFATSQHTLNNAKLLMECIGATARELDIRPSCLQMLKDIGHPFSDGLPVFDITFENVQAGERTSHLFRLANLNNAIVLGTGDLSELALGWSTYGVGDHMSHYNVNASVPKTLIQQLIRWIASNNEFDTRTASVLKSILNTEISPELIPSGSGDKEPAQKSEETVGPYELQDFNLYYITRFGFSPSKVAFLSYHAWSSVEVGSWPSTFTDDDKRSYALREIKQWLQVFVYRFFKTSQFKRTCVPNGPKVGSGGSLSPRGDWRAPSDSEEVLWINELNENVPELI